MIIFKHAGDLNLYIQQQKDAGKQIGFVPTMGALHNGHIALIERAAQDTDITVCSIFVNPTQFNNPGDYQHYPNTIEKDILQLERAGTHVLFLPSIQEMYPNGTTGLEHYDLGYLETVLEGKYRPGHFQGVCQIMNRLLTMVKPDRLFMGQKDYQQCLVVSRLLQLMARPIELITCPTIRESDGLAMSSRNLRLSADDRKKANSIYESLLLIKEQCRKNAEWAAIKPLAEQLLTSRGFTIDYIELADGDTLDLVDFCRSPRNNPRVALIAAFLGDVRLIDNMIL
jgi:pantoate--beta-alanine ligase